jgi:putative transposase
MPNHVHLVVRPFEGRELEEIVQSWKRFTAVVVNRHLERSGTLWQEESFDRIVRDEEHLWRVLQYIGRNPLLAGLDGGVCVPWIRPEWVELGWRFQGASDADSRGEADG